MHPISDSGWTIQQVQSFNLGFCSVPILSPGKTDDIIAQFIKETDDRLADFLEQHRHAFTYSYFLAAEQAGSDVYAIFISFYCETAATVFKLTWHGEPILRNY